MTISSGFPAESFFLHPENNNPQTMTAVNALHESDPKSTRERMFRFINPQTGKWLSKNQAPIQTKGPRESCLAVATGFSSTLR
jgi:hypothetical protein